MKNLRTFNLFDEVESWADERYVAMDHPMEHWQNMPSFNPIDVRDCYHSIEIKFTDVQSKVDFFNNLGIVVTNKTKSIRIPNRKHDNSRVRVKSFSENSSPRYPIYIPSKGRWNIRLTSDTLINMGIKHYMVVEEGQLEEYKKVCDPEWVTILVIPQRFFDNYETCDDRGTTMSKGPGPARNFAWWHSIELGYKRHWVMDDNIRNFYRSIGLRRLIVSDGAIFRAMEDHAEQYENVAMSGPNYLFFAKPETHLSPFVQNTRIYSCNLILNSIPHRWRGRWNEDTILSLDILKDGWCTIQYNAFLSGKIKTQTLPGGNTSEFYAKHGTKLKSEMLASVHPDVSKEVMRYGRDHHYVNYTPFKSNRLIRAADVTNIPTDNEYGMRVVYG